MTTQGMIAAGELCEGVQLLGKRSAVEFGTLPLLKTDDYQQPALIEDIFARLRITVPCRVPPPPTISTAMRLCPG